MEVIVVEKTGFGGHVLNVYRYTKETFIRMVKDEIEWAKENDGIVNENEVDEWLENEEPDNISIIESDYGIHFTVCEVEKY